MYWYPILCLADKLDLIAIGVIDVHGAAGEDGMFAGPRLVAGGDQRGVLRVEDIWRKFKCNMTSLEVFFLDVVSHTAYLSANYHQSPFAGIPLPDGGGNANEYVPQ